jgi:hypothetical protein
MKTFTLKNNNKLLIILIFLGGCASSPNQQSMSISTMDLVKSNANLKDKVNVRTVTGGKETNPLWMSKVDNQGLREALDLSLAAIGYKAQNPGSAVYQIDVNLDNLSQPMIGLTYNVTSYITYKVSKDSETISFPINAVGSAKPSDAFVGTERMKIANGRSIKNSIKEFINQISDYY